GEVQDPSLGAMRLQFDRVAFDTDGLFSPKHPTRLTAPADGIYLITADIAFRAAPHAGAGANRGAALLVDGQTVARSQLPPADQPFIALTTIYKLQKGDYVEVAVSDDDPSGPLPVVSLFGSMPSLSLAWMAPG